jgi:ureidoglycolate amidohydrolase
VKTLSIDHSQLIDELKHLATFSDAPTPAVTRIIFTQPDLAARKFLIERFKAAGLTIRIDAVGNIFARWVGTDPELPAIGTGSHTDAIPHAGMYDGTVGVLGGLAAIRALQAADFKPKRSIEVLMFTSEEPTRFGLGCLGSRLLCDAIPLERVSALRDKGGESLDDARAADGLFEPLSTVKLPKDYYAKFVELHIEQGPELEAKKIDIGAVTAIAAPSALRMTLEGSGGHAGATLMPGRRDAFLAAAEIALAVEKAALTSGSPDSVGTTGVCKVHPGAVNSIPSRVELEIDIRDTQLKSRDGMVEQVRAAANEICARRKISLTVEILNADPPAICDPAIVTAVENACKATNLTHQRMVSRAYHDSLFMARICPTAMIFIPCYKGYSHRPDEYASPEAITNGTLILAHTLAELSAS